MTKWQFAAAVVRFGRTIASHWALLKEFLGAMVKAAGLQASDAEVNLVSC